MEGEVERELRRPKVWRFGREGNYSRQGGKRKPPKTHVGEDGVRDSDLDKRA